MPSSGLILLHGRVATMSGADGRATMEEAGDCTAFAVLDGRFIAAGDNADIRALVGPRTRVLDAESRAWAIAAPTSRST